MINFAIIGNGFVGQATKILQTKDNQMKIYDIDPTKCEPLNTTISNLEDCNIIFISVPTPSKSDGSCHLDIVESVVQDIRNINTNAYIIIRSTIVIGTCDRLGCYFMPEFLTEKNWMEDFKNCENWIFGITNNNENNTNFIKCITSLITNAFESGNIKYNKITFVSNKEAEMIKYYRNTFLSLKVSFSNEIYDFCKINNINYDIISEISCEDKRIGKSHINVPGHDGKRGFGGTCFPKDTASLLYEYKKLGLKSYIINAAVERNNEIDRPEKDWENNVGRAFIH